MHPVSRSGDRSYQTGAGTVPRWEPRPLWGLQLLWERRPRREGSAPCILFRGQATAPTKPMPAHSPGENGNPRGSGGPAAKGLAQCILLRGQATAPTQPVPTHLPGENGNPVGSGGPAAKDLAPCILLRGQATAPTKPVPAHSPGENSNPRGSGGPAAKDLARAFCFAVRRPLLPSRCQHTYPVRTAIPVGAAALVGAAAPPRRV